MKRKRRLVWQLYLPYLVITIMSLVAVTWYATGTLAQFYLDQTGKDLEARANLERALQQIRSQQAQQNPPG